MLERILIAGSGGQGIILVGKLLATVAVRSVRHVTFFPSYGAEVRGGTSSCEVVLSSEEISSPVSEVFDSMVILNQDSASRFLPRADAMGLVLLNSSMCRRPGGLALVMVPASEQAVRLGDIRVANFIMLGVLLASKPLVPPHRVEDGLRQFFSERSSDVVDMNIRAFRHGLGLVRHGSSRRKTA